MEVQRIAAARTGFEHWTLRCTECGLIHEAQINAGSMKSDAAGWEDSDLQGSQPGCASRAGIRGTNTGKKSCRPDCCDPKLSKKPNNFALLQT